MGTAKTKDRILESLIKNECGVSDKAISEHLKIHQYTAYALLKEIAKDGYIEVIETATATTIGASCSVRRVFPQAYHFYDTDSYESKARREWWMDVPKKYWLVSAIFAIIIFALPLYLQYCKAPIQSQNQSGQILKMQQSDTTRVYRN